VHDHPLGLVARLRRCAAVADRVDDLQPLQLLLLAVLRRLVRDLVAQAVRPPVDTAPGLVALLERLVRRVRHAQQRAHRLGTDLRLERAVALFAGLDAQLVVLVLVEQLLELERLLRILRIHLLAGVRNDVRRVVDDLLQVTQRHAEQVAHLARQRLEEPDVRDRHGQLDVPHALAAHLRQRDLDAALVADVAAETNALELPAVAFPVLDRTEDALAEEPVTLRLERPVVDGLRLRHLAVAPAPDLLRGSDLQLDEVEVARPRLAGARKIDHLNISPAYAEWSPLHCQTAGPGPRAPGQGRGILFPTLRIRRGAARFNPGARALGPRPRARFTTRNRQLLLPPQRHRQPEGLQLLHEHVERLGDPRLGQVLALDDRLVDAAAARHVVGLHRQDLLQRVRCAVRLECPDLHLTEAL